jgi:transcriptional regulator with XRE-family HTH domain
MNIGIALLKARKDSGLRQNEVARRVKLSQTYLSQIETGGKVPSIDVIEMLAKEYNVPFPIMMWYSLTEADVRKGKLDIYRKLKPTVDSLINDIFGYNKQINGL